MVQQTRRKHAEIHGRLRTPGVCSVERVDISTVVSMVLGVPLPRGLRPTVLLKVKMPRRELANTKGQPIWHDVRFMRLRGLGKGQAMQPCSRIERGMGAIRQQTKRFQRAAASVGGTEHLRKRIQGPRVQDTSEPRTVVGAVYKATRRREELRSVVRAMRNPGVLKNRAEKVSVLPEQEEN
jgi:hypothetical protein